MTELSLPSPSSGRPRSVPARILVTGALVLLGLTPRTTAAPIKTHKQATHAPSPLSRDWSDFKSLLNKLQTKINASPPVQFAHALGLNGLSGTYNPDALTRILQGKSPIVPAKSTASTQVVAHASALHARANAAPVSVSAANTSQSAAYQVADPPATVTAKPVAEAQFVPVPEPPTVAIVLALLGLAGGWRRLRRSVG